jgi:hypothetical protein
LESSPDTKPTLRRTTWEAFNESVPRGVDIRDVLEHFDDHAGGTGWPQDYPPTMHGIWYLEQDWTWQRAAQVKQEGPILEETWPSRRMPQRL